MRRCLAAQRRSPLSPHLLPPWWRVASSVRALAHASLHSRRRCAGCGSAGAGALGARADPNARAASATAVSAAGGSQTGRKMGAHAFWPARQPCREASCLCDALRSGVFIATRMARSAWWAPRSTAGAVGVLPPAGSVRAIYLGHGNREWRRRHAHSCSLARPRRPRAAHWPTAPPCCKHARAAVSRREPPWHPPHPVRGTRGGSGRDAARGEAAGRPASAARRSRAECGGRARSAPRRQSPVGPPLHGGSPTRGRRGGDRSS